MVEWEWRMFWNGGEILLLLLVAASMDAKMDDVMIAVGDDRDG